MGYEWSRFMVSGAWINAVDRFVRWTQSKKGLASAAGSAASGRGAGWMVTSAMVRVVRFVIFFLGMRARGWVCSFHRAHAFLLSIHEVGAGERGAAGRAGLNGVGARGLGRAVGRHCQYVRACVDLHVWVPVLWLACACLPALFAYLALCVSLGLR